jgi:hypothetical protein
MEHSSQKHLRKGDRLTAESEYQPLITVSSRADRVRPTTAEGPAAFARRRSMKGL